MSAEVQGKAALSDDQRNKWDETGAAKREAEALSKRQEPFVQSPVKGIQDSFPAIVGVDLNERRRQAILSYLSGAAGKSVIGDRKVTLDNETVDWIIKEQDRLQLIETDLYFEKSCKDAGLFETPQGLEYCRKIRPEYFERREKLAKWVAETQLKLFNINMNGIRDKDDFNFMLMYQGLNAQQKHMLSLPVSMLHQLPIDRKAGVYQQGIFRKHLFPQGWSADDGPHSAFAGIGTKGFGNYRGWVTDGMGGNLYTLAAAPGGSFPLTGSWQSPAPGAFFNVPSNNVLPE
jgi:hypothetical protein